jgi:hypothetical protein
VLCSGCRGAPPLGRHHEQVTFLNIGSHHEQVTLLNCVGERRLAGTTSRSPS